MGKQQFPTAVVRSGTTVLPNSKILQPNTNPNCLEAIFILLKPRSGQKSRDATAIALKKLDWKSRHKEKENGSNTGIHGKRKLLFPRLERYYRFLQSGTTAWSGTTALRVVLPLWSFGGTTAVVAVLPLGQSKPY